VVLSLNHMNIIYRSFLICLIFSHFSGVFAQEKQKSIPKEESAQTPQAEPSLWNAQPTDTGLVNYDQKEVKIPNFNWDKLKEESGGSRFYIEHHGYFRARANLLHNFDLDTYSPTEQRGTSGVLPTLSKSQHLKSGSDSISYANIRFRYEPILHISEKLRIRTTMDIADNMILGSTPDGSVLDSTLNGSLPSAYSRPDLAFGFFNDSQRPIEVGINSYQSAFRLKNVWGEWENELLKIEVGRMRNHWGLGMVANGGQCLNCDFGDSIDRFQISTKQLDTYISLAWDFPSEGATGWNNQINTINQPFGQAKDFDQRDDINQFAITLQQRAISDDELAIRKEKLRSGKAVFEWGLYNVIRNQDMSAVSKNQNSSIAVNNSDYRLINTQSFMYQPDLFLSLSYHPTPRETYDLKLEVAGMFGSMKNLPLQNYQNLAYSSCNDPTLSLSECPSDQIIKNRYKSIQAWGYALEFRAKFKDLRWGLLQGGASGDRNAGYYGSNQFADSSVRDTTLSGFRFDRDYLVDLILFREVLGGVHNALYFKPYFGLEIPKQKDEVWGMQLSLIYSMAVKSQYTAGRESPLGLELNAEAYIAQTNRFRWSILYGFLFPLAGMNLLDTQGSKILLQAKTAQTLQMHLVFQF
jgi:uncharacterized protein (TIGR04551 family)